MGYEADPTSLLYTQHTTPTRKYSQLIDFLSYKFKVQSSKYVYCAFVMEKKKILISVILHHPVHKGLIAQ